MAEELIISEGTKKERYEALLPQIEAVISDEDDGIANMANVAAMIHQTFGFLWTGFYRVMPTKDGEELILGPFQGPLACSRIKFGKGVCGTCWKQGETQVVPDVEKFPGHIACNSLSKSEIVVPIKYGKKVVAVIDIDSEELNTFDEVDKTYLEQICALL